MHANNCAQHVESGRGAQFLLESRMAARRRRAQARTSRIAYTNQVQQVPSRVGLPTFLQVLFRPNLAFYSEQLDRKDVMSLYRCPQPTAGRGAGLAKGWPCRALAAIGLDTAALRHSLAIIATVICDTKVGPSSSPAQSRITQLLSLPPRMNGRTEFHSQAWYTRRRAAGRRPSEGRARGHGPVLSKPGI